MQELALEHFHRAFPLLADVPHDRTIAEAVEEGRRSRMFVDDADEPRVVLACDRSGISILAEDASPDRAYSLIEEVVMGAPNPPRISFISLPYDELADAILEHFGNRFAVRERISFTSIDLDANRFRDWRSMIPGGCEIRWIDSELAGRVGEVDLDYPEMWPDPAEFVSLGAGFCLMEGERMVSVAYSALPPKRLMEIAVATVPDCWGRGFSPLTTSALIDYCIAKGIEPRWSTDVCNLQSQAAARKLGFKDEVIHNWVQYTPWNAGRRSIRIAPEVLDTLVGVYEVRKGRRIFISREGETLYIRFWNDRQPKMDLGAESDMQFFLKAADIQVTFQRGLRGSIRGLKYTHGGRRYSARRVG